MASSPRSLSLDAAQAAAPVLNYDRLCDELDLIQNKRIGDKNWFAIDDAGRLVLVERPTSFFALVWEAVCRAFAYVISCFCSSESALEKKLVQVARDVESMLKHPTPEAWQSVSCSEFLQRYTPALNALYNSAHRMHNSGRLSDAACDALDAISEDDTSETSALLITPYRPTSFIAFQNNLTAGRIHAVVRNPNYADSLQRDFYLLPGERECIYTRDLGQHRATDDENEVTVSVTHELDLSKNQHKKIHVYVSEDGRMAIAGYGHDGEFPQIKFQTANWEGGRKITLNIGDSRGLSLHLEKNSEKIYTLLDGQAMPKISSIWYSTDTFHLGCKAGRYTCLINNFGVTPSVEAVKTRELARQDFSLGKTQARVCAVGEEEVRLEAPTNGQRKITVVNALAASKHEIWVRLSIKKAGDQSRFFFKHFALKYDAESLRMFSIDTLNAAHFHPQPSAEELQALQAAEQLECQIDIDELIPLTQVAVY